MRLETREEKFSFIFKLLNYPSGVCQRQNSSPFYVDHKFQTHSSKPPVIGSEFCTALCVRADRVRTKHRRKGLIWKSSVDLLCISAPESRVQKPFVTLAK
ncbi:Hypothetical predicted protein [Xyrichtys novacula]|uniref:Uncharacterized protein n=1 Tax=Xyrichtys novacula TaxID=13765 RepID=A0AAV1FH21_XYRNO|nr:Hypothetical predicted protein [Xyrichtys novacula]